VNLERVGVRIGDEFVGGLDVVLRRITGPGDRQGVLGEVLILAVLVVRGRARGAPLLRRSPPLAASAPLSGQPSGTKCCGFEPSPRPSSVWTFSSVRFGLPFVTTEPPVPFVMKWELRTVAPPP